MDTKQIINAVKKYVQDENARYALMINGIWGCGKTFLYEKYLCDAIAENEAGKNVPKTNIYISLYGISSVETLSKQVLSSLSSVNKLDINKGHVTVRTAGLIAALTKSITISFPAVSLDAGKALDGIINSIDIQNLVICFDDFERCIIPLNDLLGYINNLVEHCGCKVIILADEEKVKKAFTYNNLEGKYQTILSGGRRIVDKSVGVGYERNNSHDTEPISINELKKLTEKLYSENYHYEEIREKVIGKTYWYTPKLPETISALIQGDGKSVGYAGSGDYQKYLIECMAEVTSYFEEMGCYNVRVIISWVVGYKKIYDYLLKNKDNSKYYDMVFGEILHYSIWATVRYRTTKEWSSPIYRQNDDLHLVYYNRKDKTEYLSFYFYNKYLESDYIDEVELRNEIKYIEAKYQQQELVKERENGNALKGTALEVCEKWRIIEDEDVYKNVDKMIKELKEKRYSFDNYSTIIALLLELSEVDLFNGDLLSVIDIMIWCINQDQEIVEVGDVPEYFDDEEKIRKFNHLYSSVLRCRKDRNRELSRNEIAEQNVYANAESFCNHCETNRAEYISRLSFIGYLKLDDFYELINKSNLKEIYLITDAIIKVYEGIYEDKMFKIDRIYASRLVKSIEENCLKDSSGITRQEAIRYLKKKIIHLFESMHQDLNSSIVIQ